jgi:hypothetical protein
MNLHQGFQFYHNRNVDRNADNKQQTITDVDEQNPTLSCMERMTKNSQKQARPDLFFGTSIRSLAVILNKHFLTSFLLRNVSKDLKAVLASSACPEDFPVVELMSEGVMNCLLAINQKGAGGESGTERPINRRWARY